MKTLTKLKYDRTQETLAVTLSGVQPSEYPDFLADLLNLAQGRPAAPDPLADATRPGGTPVSKLHRELEDEANASKGEVVVTHAAGAAPVLVPKGDEPVGVPPTEEQPKPAKKKKAKKTPKKTPPRVDKKAPEPEPEPAAPEPEPEVDEAEKRAAHAQRWAGKAKYTGGESIVGMTITGDYVVVLELNGGTKVFLDEDDKEIKREGVTNALSNSDSIAGDFKPNTSDAPEPEPEPEPAPPTPPAGDVPKAAVTAKNVRELVTVFAKDQAGTGPEVAAKIADQVVAASAHNTVIENFENLRNRALRVLMMLGKITNDEFATLEE